MSDKTLTVLLPNYNYGHFIGATLEAIFKQSFAPKEVIVVDDGSHDNSLEIIERYRQTYPNLILVKNKQNLGTNISNERSLAIATGDYVYAGAADDWPLPGFFERSMELLAKYPQAGFCCGDIEVYDGTNKFEKRAYLSDRPRYFSPSEALELFRRHPFTPFIPHSIIFKRQALASAGGYRPELEWTSDSFAFSVISFREGFCYRPEKVAVMRVHASQWGSANAKKTNLERQVIRKLFEAARLPEYADVLPLFEKTAPFSVYPWEVLWVAAGNKKYWPFISFKLLRYALFDKLIRRPLLKVMPWGLARRTINLANYLKFILLKWLKK